MTISAESNSESARDDDPYGIVYFISHGASGPIKVGFTRDLDVGSRLKQLQTGSPEPLEVAGKVLAHASIERAIQAFLRPHLVRGEWFEREPALMVLARLELGASPNARSDFVAELSYLLVRPGRTGAEPRADEPEDSLAVAVGRALLRDWVEQLEAVNTAKPLPFRAWLLTQTTRDDPIGDLARDVARGGAFPATGALADYLAMFTDDDRSAAVIRTVVDAWIACDQAVANLSTRDRDLFDWGRMG